MCYNSRTHVRTSLQCSANVVNGFKLKKRTSRNRDKHTRRVVSREVCMLKTTDHEDNLIYCVDANNVLFQIKRGNQCYLTRYM